MHIVGLIGGRQLGEAETRPNSETAVEVQDVKMQPNGIGQRAILPTVSEFGQPGSGGRSLLKLAKAPGRFSSLATRKTMSPGENQPCGKGFI
jgi:hypothetical protein